MSLRDYRRKRDFDRSPEPEGGRPKGEPRWTYVVQKHAARRLHYDFRLELDGVLKSWAVPKGPSLDPGEKRLAVHVEDHPLEYGDFEGIIPAGEYGGGTVMIWDRGEWEPIGDPREGYRKGNLKFRLSGAKLSGSWTLARMSGEPGEEDKNWLLIKKKDGGRDRRQEVDILEAKPLSVVSGRSMEEIAEEKERVWTQTGSVSGREAAEPAGSPVEKTARKPEKSLDPSSLPGAREARQPESMRPQLATLVKAIPRGDGWLFEIKYDGYRMVCVKSADEIRLITRNGNDWTAKFPEIVEAARSLPVRKAILDGEIVVLRKDGTTDFQALQNVLEGIAGGLLVYYVFDLPHCEGYDLTRVPLIERKRLLRQVVENAADSSATLRFGDHMEGQGSTFLQAACQHALEGVVCKRANSAYQQTRSRSWVKVKCLKRQEFVVGGYSDPSGSRKGFGALLLGYYDESSRLIYAGRVGTGFNAESLTAIASRLKDLEQSKPPFDPPPGAAERRGAHWVRPQLVVEVEFGFWTDDGRLRHASFQGLRQDKAPREVVREEPEPRDGYNSPPPPTKKTETKAPSAKAQRQGKMKTAEVAGVKLTNPERILYPEQGITKLELASFYERISGWILPHIVGRPLTLVRCPQGSGDECFYQRHFDEAASNHLHGISVQESDGEALYVGLDGLPGLIQLVQLGVLEIHPWGSREDNIEKPDRLIFDLDPGPGVSWKEVVDGVHLLHERLQRLGLESYLKTTGGKGLHVAVPLVRRAEWPEVKEFAKAVAEDMARRDPKRYVAVMSKGKRTGKIFVDYIRNNRTATSVAPYSTRARAGAPVSTPIRWDEISPRLESQHFTVENLPSRLSKLKEDPWKGFFEKRQSITKAMQQELGLL